jgi:hypothetical protein
MSVWAASCWKTGENPAEEPGILDSSFRGRSRRFLQKRTALRVAASWDRLKGGQQRGWAKSLAPSSLLSEPLLTGKSPHQSL